jgi:short-subunit dehydrogenase
MATRSPASAQLIHPGATRTAIHAKSGASREQMKWDKFPAAETVAQQIVKQIARGQRTSVVGWANRLLYFVGRSFPTAVDRGFLFSTRRKLSEQTTPPDRRPEPRHCVITGAADGIGKALTLTFAANGYTITGIDVDAERAKQALAEVQQFDPKASFIIANLAVASEVERVAVELAQRPLIDLCIHNAGINAVGAFAELPIAEQLTVLQVNLTAPLLLTAALQRQQRLHPQSTLVFVASLSHYVSYPGAAVYAASKDGLASFARSLRIISQAAGGQVLTIYPGPTRTAHARRYSPDNRNEQRRMAPAQLAQQVWQAVQRRQSSLIPGLGNQFFALLGHWLPGLTEKVMRRLIFDKINPKP